MRPSVSQHSRRPPPRSPRTTLGHYTLLTYWHFRLNRRFYGKPYIKLFSSWAKSTVDNLKLDHLPLNCVCGGAYYCTEENLGSRGGL